MSETPRPLVLVADDDEDIRLVIRINLELDGIEVMEAGTAESLLERAHERTPDVILLDGFLPGDDGWNLLALFKHDAVLAGVPVVMLSGMTSERYRTRALQAGAAAWIDKPFKPQTLVRIVHAVLDARRLAERAP
jgi:DNA-binding response OmpR family regulator